MNPYLVQHFLDTSAMKHGSNVAAVLNDQKISYDQLFTASNALANFLISRGIQRHSRILICINNSIESLIAIFAALKADGIYIPVDIKYPADRLSKILADSEPHVIFCTKQNAKSIEHICKNRNTSPLVFNIKWDKEFIIYAINPITKEEKRVDLTDIKSPTYQNIDIDIAYILYTSGSTGTPKGVMITHQNIFNYINWAVDCFDITGKDIVLNTAPFHFDMSTFDIYTTIKVAARLIIAPQLSLLFPGKLFELIENEKVTIWKGVSSLLMYLSRGACLSSERIPSLRKVLFGGEPLATKYLMQWQRTFPEKQFFNVYGPTEATGISTFYPIKKNFADPFQSIPIGRACNNSEVFLLKDDGTKAEKNEMGEICIRGSSLSPGYWKDERKTKENFIYDPTNIFSSDKIYKTGDLARELDDGNLEYIGRKDNQIKYMGYRIDLTEIETALLSLNIVADAAVFMQQDKKYDVQQIIAFVVLVQRVGIDNVCELLKTKLPDYMIPKKVLEVDFIPRNSRGKLDRFEINKLMLKHAI